MIKHQGGDNLIIFNKPSMEKDAIKILKFLMSKKEKEGHILVDSLTLAENLKWDIKKTNNAISYLRITEAIKYKESKVPKMKDNKIENIINYSITDITSNGIYMLKSNTEVVFNLGPIFLKQKI